MKQINIWDLWEKNWENASNFFQSKGNTTTRSKLKNKWYKEFVADLNMVEMAVGENLTKHNNDLKKVCPICKGKGFTIDFVNENHTTQCDECGGTGKPIIKS